MIFFSNVENTIRGIESIEEDLYYMEESKTKFNI